MLEIPLWFIFASLAAFVRGSNSFLVKVISHKDLDSSTIFLIQMFIASIILVFYIDFDTFHILYTTPILIYTFLIGLLLFFHKKLSVLTLKDVSSSIMFISTRIFPAIFLLFISIFLFYENLKTFELIGLLLGIITFIFLYDPTDTAKKNSNFKRGIKYLSLNIITGTLLIVFIKYAISINVLYTLFLYSSFCFLFFYLEGLYKRKIYFQNIKNKQNMLYGFLFALFFIISNYFLFLALNLANTAVVYKIFSYEIFIPIILSIIFYKEKITIRKLIAIILTVVSLLFFI